MRNQLFAVGMTAAVVYSAHAADATAPAIVVTATRTAQTVDESLASVSVITRDDIARDQPQDLYDLLRTQAGIDLTRAGGPGGNTSLFLRGTNSNHTLVLIDGVRVASATTGAFDWRSLPVAQIDRIEIVRGPRAVVYGSDAIGGVIQIFTRQPQDPEAAVRAGSHKTVEAEAGWGGGSKIRGGAYLSGSSSEGFSAQNARGFAYDPDNDGYRQQNVTGFIGADLGKQTTLDVRAWQNTGYAEFDQGSSDMVNRTVSARLRQQATSKWTHTLSAGYALDDIDTRSSAPSQYTTDRYMADWQHDIALGAVGLLTAGLSFVEEKARYLDKNTNAVVYDESTNHSALFALWQQRLFGLDLQLGVRGDDYSSFGTHGSGSAAIGTDLTQATRMWVSYGSAFRAPSANDLYSPGFGGSYAGNPNLKPERSHSAELGMVMKPTSGERITANVFDTRITDLIAFEGTNNQAINVAEASVLGMEVAYELDYRGWVPRLSATFQRARNETTNAELLYRPDQKGTVSLQRRFERGGSAGAQLILVGPRTGSSGSLPGYGVVNLAASLPIASGWSAEGRLENLFDKDYEVVEGYNTPGRSIFAGVRYAPQPATR